MAPLCNLRRWRRWRLGFSGMEYKFYMIHIYLYKIYKGFLLPPEGVPTLGLYSPLISLCAFVLSLTVLLWYTHKNISRLHIYMTCLNIKLVMVVVGINSALLRSAGARRLRKTLRRCPAGAKIAQRIASWTWDVTHERALSPADLFGGKAPVGALIGLLERIR